MNCDVDLELDCPVVDCLAKLQHFLELSYEVNFEVEVDCPVVDCLAEGVA